MYYGVVHVPAANLRMHAAVLTTRDPQILIPEIPFFAGYSYKSHDSFNKFSLEFEYMRAHKVQYTSIGSGLVWNAWENEDCPSSRRTRSFK